MCQPKRRRMERSERGVQLGFRAFLRFYEIAQGSSRTRTFEDFCDSAYYGAFVKWGRYCVNTRVINPTQFVEWLLKHNCRIDNWASDQEYDRYLQDYLRRECMNDALARSLEWSMDWAETNTAPAHDCLRYGNINAILYAITTGRISPWVIYNSKSGQAFLENLTSEQVAMIWPYVDSVVWQQKFRDFAADQAYAQEILHKAGW
jgi:hypothetical protein